MDKIDSGTKLKCTHIFKENINRVWVCLRNCALLNTIDPTLVSTITMTKGKNTWTMGSEYQGNWIGVSRYTGKCVEVASKSHYKKISWILALDIQIKCQKTLHFHEITIDDSTLVVCEVSLVDIEDDSMPNFEEKSFYMNLFHNQLKKGDKYLKDTAFELYNYESCIIKRDFLFLWNYVTDMNKNAEISQMIGNQFEYKGDKYAKGTFIKGFNTQMSKVVYFRVVNVMRDAFSNIWSYVIEPFGSNTIFPKQSIEISVTRINECECQVSFHHSFYDPISRKVMAKLAKEKRNFLILLRRSCQNESNDTINL